VLQDFLHWLGFGLCHQLPERSFFGSGIQVPVCARDTGIYVGFLLSFVVISLLHRGERRRGFPNQTVWLIMGVSLAAMAWDGITSYSGLRTTTNDIRLLTGLLTGFSAAVVVYPMLQEELWTSSSAARVLSPARKVVQWVFSIAVAFALIRWVAPLMGVAYPVVVAFAIVFTLAAINLVIIAMIPAFDRRGRGWRDILAPAALATALAFLEIAGSAQIRTLLEAWIGKIS